MKGKADLNKLKPAKRWELVEHEQDAVLMALCVQFLRQAPADLVEYQSNKRFRPADVGRRHNEIERHWLIIFDKVSNPPVASARHSRDHRIAVETEKGHGGRKHARPLVLAFVQQFARGPRHDGMRLVAQMARRHHGAQCGLDGPLWVGKEVRDARKRLIWFGVENMQDRADQERMAGFLPMVPAFQCAFGIDQNVSDVLHVAHLGVTAADLE